VPGASIIAFLEAVMKRTLALLALALASLSAAAQEREVVVKERTFGCRSPEETQRFYSMALTDRKEDAARYATEKKCRMFSGGDKVAVVDPVPTLQQNGVRHRDDPTVYYVPAASAR
jgi:hypothetical protein